MMEQIYYSYMDSPVGRLLLAGDELAVRLISFSEGKAIRHPKPDWLRRNDLFTELKEQLAAYFAGELTTFSVPIQPEGTAFQKKVWQALREIPYGETRSYGEIARRLGATGASRAVGAANGQNPLPIVIPCHRVIGSDGKLTGFGGGVANKKRLLAIEQAAMPFTLSFS